MENLNAFKLWDEDLGKAKARFFLLDDKSFVNNVTYVIPVLICYRSSILPVSSLILTNCGL